MDVEIRDLPPQRYWGMEVKVVPADVGRAVPGVLAAIYGSISGAGRSPVGPPFVTSIQMVGDEICCEVGVPCDEAPAAADGVHAGELPACLAAVYLNQSAYEELEAVYGDLRSWVDSHGYSASGTMREIYLTGPDDPRGLMTKVVCPVTARP
jgi:effector-binding domain-containing protein